MESSCFIWDQIFPENLWGAQKHVLSKQEKVDVFDFSSVSSVYILAELKWGDCKRTDFIGIKILQQLRLQNMNLPVVVCSFTPREQLINEYNFEILRFKAHGFIHLPNEKQIAETDMFPLTQMEMLDVQFHFCGLKGAISNIYHRKQQAGTDIPSAKKYLENMLMDIRKLKNLPLPIIEIIDNDINLVNGIKDLTDLENFMALPVTHITSFLQNEKDIVYSFDETKVRPEGHWEVLLLDDEPESVAIKSINKALTDLNIKVHLVSNVSNAKKILTEDVYNRIVVVISDYRLENAAEIKEDQGYVFVQWISAQPRLNSIFILSGLDRYFVKKLFKEYAIKVHPENKNELNSSRLISYVNDIVEAGNSEYNCILNMPASGDWNPHLRKYYAHYRTLPDHDNIEHRVSLRAKRIINELNLFFSLKSSSRRSWFNDLLSQGPVIKNSAELTSRLFDPVTKVTLPINNKTWSTFIEVLVYRRVAIYLFEEKNMKRGLVSGLINRGKYINDASKGLVFTRIGLSQFDFPDNILVEEVNWFKTYLFIDPNERSIALQESIVFFERIINDIEIFLNDNFNLVKAQIDNMVSQESDHPGNPESAYFSIIPKEDKNAGDPINSGSSKLKTAQAGLNGLIKIHPSSVKELKQIICTINRWNIIHHGTADYGKQLAEKLDELIKLNVLILEE